MIIATAASRKDGALAVGNTDAVHAGLTALVVTDVFVGPQRCDCAVGIRRAPVWAFSPSSARQPLEVQRQLSERQTLIGVPFRQPEHRQYRASFWHRGPLRTAYEILILHHDSVSVRAMAATLSEVSGQSYRPFWVGSLAMLGAIIGLAKPISPQADAPFPAWQGMQYLRDQFGGDVQLVPLDNARYPDMK